MSNYKYVECAHCNKPGWRVPPVRGQDCIVCGPNKNTKRIGISLSAFDDDEWSWAVEYCSVVRVNGAMQWGSSSDILAEGCETSKREALDNIVNKLTELGLTIKDVSVLPF